MSYHEAACDSAGLSSNDTAVLERFASSAVVPVPFVYRDIASFFSHRLSSCLVELLHFTGCLGRESTISRRLAESGSEVRDLYEHQHAFVTWVLRRIARGDRLSINASAPGLGKTLAVLAAVAITRCDNVLVVAPDHLVHFWGRQADLLGLSWCEWDGGRILPPCQVVILGFNRMGRANFAHLIEPTLCLRQWELLVVDEMHLLGQSKYTLKKKVITGLVQSARHVIGLSGTQLPYGIDHWKQVMSVLGNENYTLEPFESMVRNFVFRTSLDGLCDRARLSLPKVQIIPHALLKATDVERFAWSHYTGDLLLPWMSKALNASGRQPRLIGEAETKRLLVVKAEANVKKALAEYCVAAVRARQYDRVVYELHHDRDLHINSTALRDAYYLSTVVLQMPAATHLRAAMIPSAEQLDWLQQMADCVPWSQRSRFNLDDFWSQEVANAQKQTSQIVRSTLQDDDFSWLLACEIKDKKLLESQPQCVLGRHVVQGDLKAVVNLLSRLGNAHQAMIDAVTMVCCDDYADDERLLSYLHCSDSQHFLHSVGKCTDCATRTPASTAQQCPLCHAISAQAEFMSQLELCVPYSDLHGCVTEDPSRTFFMHADEYCDNRSIRSIIGEKGRRLAEALDVHAESMCRHHNGLHFNVQWLLRAYEDNDRAYPCAEQVICAFLGEFLARLPPQQVDGDSPALRHLSALCIKGHRLGRRCKCHPFDINIDSKTTSKVPSSTNLYTTRRLRDITDRLTPTRDISTKLDYVLATIEKTRHALVMSNNIDALKLLRSRAGQKRTDVIDSAMSAKRVASTITDANPLDIVYLHSGHANFATCVDLKHVTDIVFVEVPTNWVKIEHFLRRFLRLDVKATHREVKIHLSLLDEFEECDTGFTDWLRRTMTVCVAHTQRYSLIVGEIQQIAMRKKLLKLCPTPPNPAIRKFGEGALMSPVRSVSSVESKKHTAVRVIITPVRSSVLQIKYNDSEFGSVSGCCCKYKVRKILH